ncbi:MFS transporter [Mangrovibacterium diazotrophicum]|uniref:PAT family beta-lactamase induction signal transducer AmpG n=1 Tax=Mangrovibacterium diazotrophicum TaxID=1261403 RepID=A0A419W9J3_9BACT|nr:MFS transporter [Mangrovibacterium diazotrophicum]RKD92133.1 PAT family beta-lactamase induction signal transducer AmpG [Mangrovibacterium diazotrophicum]
MTVEKTLTRQLKLPALSENAFLRYLTFSALYFAQGIPMGLMFYAIPAWLAANGKTPAEIGSFVAAVSLPWSFKILVAPLMDRFTYLPMGRRRPWLVFGQVGIVASFLLLAPLSDPLEHIPLLTVAGFMASLASIFQDISVDSLAIDLLPEDQQARANGLMWGSQAVGVSSTVAITGWIIQHYSFLVAMNLFGAIVTVIMLFPLIFRERPGEKVAPWTAGQTSPEAQKIQLCSWKVILKSLIRAFTLPVSLYMGVAVFVYRMGDGFIGSILPVFTVQKLGWTDIEYAHVFATTKLAGGILGMFIGGAMIDRFGKIRMMVLYAFALVALLMAMSLLSLYWSNATFITGFFFIYHTLSTFITIAILAVAMQLSWRRVATTQFTLYMTIANLGLSAGAWIMGQLKTYFSWQHMFMAYLVFIGLVLAIMPFLNFKKHQQQLNELEEKQRQIQDS